MSAHVLRTHGPESKNDKLVYTEKQDSLSCPQTPVPLP